jgi:glutamate carboxypeptidase
MTTEIDSMDHELLSFCQSQDGWLRETVEALVRLESPSDDKLAVDRCGRELERRLAAIGGVVDRIAQEGCGDHLRADFGGPGRPPAAAEEGRRDGNRVLLLGHFDTVWPVGSLDRMPLREADGRLYGPGIFDMKSGIAVSMLAVRALAALDRQGPAAVVMLWTTDEEVGSATSRSIIEEEARRSRAVLVLEPSLPGGGAKTSRKGVGEFEIVVHGVSAHAGLDPGKGASAIHELARQVLRIETLRDLTRGITLNVGTILGGTRANVVADRAAARVDVRVQTVADAATLEAAILGLRPDDPATRLEITGGINRPPLERSSAVVRLYEKAATVARGLGRDLAEGAAGGGSDGNFTAACGVPTLDGLGPRGDGAHALHEHVVIDDLTWRAAFLASLIASLG